MPIRILADKFYYRFFTFLISYQSLLDSIHSNKKWGKIQNYPTFPSPAKSLNIYSETKFFKQSEYISIHALSDFFIFQNPIFHLLAPLIYRIIIDQESKFEKFPFQQSKLSPAKNLIIYYYSTLYDELESEIEILAGETLRALILNFSLILLKIIQFSIRLKNLKKFKKKIF